MLLVMITRTLRTGEPPGGAMMDCASGYQPATEDVDWTDGAGSLPDQASIAGLAAGHTLVPVHLEWGWAGLREGGRLADVVVVVDVLSFSTAVAAAVAAGVDVYPLRPHERYAERMAERLG